jgi:hypothetical protein
MQCLIQRAATHLKKSGRFGLFQIIAGLLGANAAGAALGHLHALGNIAADVISDCMGGQILQSIPALAGMGGGLDLSSITGQAVGGAAGAILTLMAGILRTFIFAQNAPRMQS